VGSAEGQLLILDLKTGEPVRPPVSQHDDAVTSLAYSADGSRIVTSAPDSTAALWDADSGRLVDWVVTPEQYVVATFLEGAADTLLIAPEGEGTVYRWRAEIDEALDHACAIAGRDLTQAGWTNQFDELPYRPVCPR
jgi:WD40 repeat protein